MTPTLVHRYTWPIREAIGLLLGDAAGDCDAWRIRVEGDEVVVDVVAPAIVVTKAEIDEGLAILTNETAKSNVASSEADETPAARVTVEEAPSIEMPQPGETSNEVEEINTPPEEPPPPRKGGALAQRAAIACGEKGFWTFILKKYSIGVGSAEEAATWLKVRCGILSRADLDHEDVAAGIYRDIDSSYRLWLEGFD